MAALPTEESNGRGDDASRRRKFDLARLLGVDAPPRSPLTCDPSGGVS